jgi:hypothetical protein
LLLRSKLLASAHAFARTGGVERLSTFRRYLVAICFKTGSCLPRTMAFARAVGLDVLRALRHYWASLTRSGNRCAEHQRRSKKYLSHSRTPSLPQHDAEYGGLLR